MIIRRKVLALTTAVAVAIFISVVGAQSRPEKGGGAAPQLEGTWVVTLHVGGGTFTSLNSYARGGVLIETNNVELSPPVSTNGQGVWEKVGDHQFAYTFMQFQFDGSGNPSGTVNVRGVITLSGKDTYTGTEQIEFKDTAGNVTFATCDTVEATRMAVAPLTSCP
jgi:hypothetical protein